MTYSHQLLAWCSSNESRLRGLGEVVVRSYDQWQAKPAALLNIRSASGESELLVWDSGEAEVHIQGATGVGGQHHEIRTAGELLLLVESVVGLHND